ncbi:hypothetical protein BT67DRAFT_83207 [Trichocladium antarcticum]|uniref:Uncharacterized protein n=1 Tax=Trichocladium antarcticum TaxID=1450529 RepID=A0AAN6UGS7_9PEZI|nr:hypothetical protein BT67DRAFT_83207 [Trichocladium antarcticum]
MPVIAGHATASSLFSFPRTSVGLRKHYQQFKFLSSIHLPTSSRWSHTQLGRCFGNEPFQPLAQPHPLKILGPLEIPSASQPHGCGLSHGPDHLMSVCSFLPFEPLLRTQQAAVSIKRICQITRDSHLRFVRQSAALTRVSPQSCVPGQSILS